MTLPACSVAAPANRSASSAPADVFGGIAHPSSDVDADGLLDSPPARRWLDLIARARADDVYTFQQPLDGRSGAHVSIDGRSMLMMSAYDYLGLIGDERIEHAAVEAVRAYGTGTGGVRLLTGTTALHGELERALADFKGTEAALVFTSGYMAILGAITALFGRHDRAIVDARIHRSTLDACALAGVPYRRFRHNDPADLEAELRRPTCARRTLVAVEGVYSMDGDTCALPQIAEVSRRHHALLMVDEAHAFGVLGASGRGVDEHWGVPSSVADIWVGSLSKAIPSNGGFIAGSRSVMAYLQHGAAPFMFSSALCPAAAGAALEALAVIRAEPGRLARLRATSDHLRQGVREAGFDAGASTTPIIPILLRNSDRALRLARHLFGLGVLASAIIPPAVPPGRARLRLCATAAHSHGDIDEALRALRLARDQQMASSADA
jgi:glycine C-acetyltransferase